ncbi:Dentin matrix protein 4-like protein, partial [Leptotrombidium deliense]
KNLSHWEKFQLNVRQYYLYADEDASIRAILQDMVRLPIVRVEQKDGGTQLKLIIDYENSGQALFKPMRLVSFRVLLLINAIKIALQLLLASIHL